MASLPARRAAAAGWSRTQLGTSQTPSIAIASQPLRPSPSIPACRAPSVSVSSSLSASFSTTHTLEKRQKYRPRDMNRDRGVSSIRQTGPRYRLSVSDDPIPRPALTGSSLKSKETAAAVAAPAIDPEHGLWQFFYDGKVAQTPAQDAAIGRSWTVEELRRKSWEDLHKLWWVCVKERNRIATARVARDRYDLGFGDIEADDRDLAVRRTMRGIKHTLTERFYAWEDAVELAKTDPEIDLSGQGPAFQPSAYLEEDPADRVPEAAAPEAPAPAPAAGAPETAAR